MEGYTGADVEVSGPPWELFHPAGNGDILPTLDFCLYDSAGRLRLGRAGVELWSHPEPDDAYYETFTAKFYAGAEEGHCPRFDELHFNVHNEAGRGNLFVLAILPAAYPRRGAGPAARAESPPPPGPRFPCIHTGRAG